MVDVDAPTGIEDGGLFPRTVGERLRAARTAAGLDLNDIATKTRVPTRHLEAIERGEYASLPSSTYALGFARSFARAVGLDEREIGRDLRTELGRAPIETADAQPYEPVDPARLPSRLLAWTAAGIAVVLLAGYLWLSRDRFEGVGTAAPPAVVATVSEPAAPAAQPSAAPGATGPNTAGTNTTGPGQVVLTATAPVWLRIYDKADKVIVQKEMTPGESFTVPADADTPMIRTGRPDALRVAVDGRDVAPLGPPERTVRDVVLTATALAARLPASVPTPSAPATLPAPTTVPRL